MGARNSVGIGLSYRPPSYKIDKIETEMKDVDRIRKAKALQVYATLSRVSFWGIPFTQYHILFPPADSLPSKK
jgi:hypothetical protein